MTPLQERRLREMRSRVLVRAFEYRQRRHARGVWYRLRCALALSKEAYIIPALEADRLVAEGHRPAPVGRELEPSRTIVFVPAARVAQIVSARPTPVRLSAELLGAEALALVPFPPGRGLNSREAPA